MAFYHPRAFEVTRWTAGPAHFETAHVHVYWQLHGPVLGGHRSRPREHCPGPGHTHMIVRFQMRGGPACRGTVAAETGHRRVTPGLLLVVTCASQVRPWSQGFGQRLLSPCGSAPQTPPRDCGQLMAICACKHHMHLQDLLRSDNVFAEEGL